MVSTKMMDARGLVDFFFEHWVYSHPSVRPCDLYPGKEYTWAYENIPNEYFEKDLKEAPRFDFSVFANLLRQNYWYCREDTSSETPQGYLENRKWYYKQLYGNVFLGKSWYLRKFLNVSSDLIFEPIDE